MFRLDRLQSFVAFADAQSFTEAARVLHISQPALHAQIKALGDELGVPLYRRVGRGVELTWQGRELAAFARETAARAHGLTERLQGRDPTRPLVVSAGAAAVRYLLMPALSEWRARSSRRLRVVTTDASGTLEAVASSRALVGVTAPGQVPAELRAHPLAVVPQVLVVPRTDPLADRRDAFAEDLAGRALLVPPPGRPQRARIDAVLAGVPWTVSAEIRGWELTVELAEQGQGLALVNAFVPLPESLVAVPFPELVPVRYAVLRRRDAPRSADVEALVELFCAVTAGWRRGSPGP